MSYEDSYAKAFPFDKMADGILNTLMIEDTIYLILKGIKCKQKMIIIINNRAGGNAPMIARLIAERFLAT